MKKETKTTKKATKKTVKPKFVVDLTKVYTADDIQFEFIKAKATQGAGVSEEDIKFLVNLGANMMIDIIDAYIGEIGNKAVVCTDKKIVTDIINYIEKKISKKDPWYKRAWKWIKHPFKKNK